jgi:hypothetical protein
MLVVSGIVLALAFRRISEERDRAETDEWERMQASQQRVARAKSLLDTDPAGALDVLRELPFDAWEHVQRDAWLVAVATTSTVPAREVHVSPGSGYLSAFVMADGSVLGLRDIPAPPTERLHPPIAIERFTGGAGKPLAFAIHDLDPVASADPGRREGLRPHRRGHRTLRVWELERGGPDRLPIGNDPDGFAVIDDRAIVTTQTAAGHTLIAWTPGGAPVKVDVPHATSDDIIWTTTNGTSPPIAAFGDRVAAMMGDKLELVDLATGTHAELDVDGYPARLVFSPDGKQMLAAGAKLQVWDLATHALTEPHGTTAAWLGDGRLVTADRSGVHVGATKLELDTCKPSALDARDAVIAVGCLDGTLRVFRDGGPAVEVETISQANRSPILVVAISPSGSVAAAGSRPEVLVSKPNEHFTLVLYGETRAVTRLHWAGEVLESATPSDGWIWDPVAANGGAKLPPGAKILLGMHHSFAANDEERVVRATLLPPRLLVGFHAWLLARSR